eukprot:309744-Pelagomonas_calceolata.AAC.1
MEEQHMHNERVRNIKHGQKERRTLAMRPRALRQEPPIASRRRGHLFLHPGHKDLIWGPPSCYCPPRA